MKYVKFDDVAGFQNATARALNRCQKLEALYMDGNVEDSGVVVFVDGLSSRLVELSVRTVAKQCGETIAKRFTKVRKICMRHKREEKVLRVD